MKFHIDKYYRLKSGYVTLVYRISEQPDHKQDLQISLGGQSVSFKDVFPDDLLEMSEAMQELYKRLEEQETETSLKPESFLEEDSKVASHQRPLLGFFKK